jgi:hypothetical protein
MVSQQSRAGGVETPQSDGTPLSVTTTAGASQRSDVEAGPAPRKPPSTGNVNSRSPRGGGQVGDADAMMVVMSEPAQPITLTIPPHVAAELPRLSAELNERMHELLERNTDGALSDIERRELDTLVRMAGFGQILELMATRQSAA